MAPGTSETGQQPPAVGHLAGQALHAMDRLHDHIARLDEGKAYAADDLAVVLRLLVGKGQGLNLLHRITRPGTEPVRFLASRAPETAETHFSFGRLPARDGSEPLGSTAVTLHEWLSSTFLSIRLGNTQKNYTWERFISSYSNKWGGAHVDNKVPPELMIIDKFAFGGYSLSSYFLRAAGVIVWKAAQVIWTNAQLPGIEIPIVEGEYDSVVVSSSGDRPDPTDRLRFGEPQFLSYRGDSLELLAVMSRHSNCSARIALGGISYDMEVKPENAAIMSKPLVEPRTPVKPPLTASDFSLGRHTHVSARFIVGD